MRNILAVIMIAILAIALVAEANADAKSSTDMPSDDGLKLIVGFHESIPKDIDEKVKAHGAEVVSKNTDINFVVVDPKGKNRGELMRQLHALPGAAYVENDHIATAFFEPNDPSYPNQWGLPDISAPLAWDVTLGNSSVIVAIVDTGVDYKHLDIAANYLGGYDWVNKDNDPIDDNGHGTHVAGIAAAVTNNGIGVAGISQSKIMAEKVLGSDGSGSYSAIANGITHAANNGARVISMSLGGSFPSSTLKKAVNYAWTKGALLVAAAGNSGSMTVSYPAAYDKVIAVSALDKGDTLASYSNFGNKIELSAPGSGILSTYPGGGYVYMSGTSMATPFVSGSAALVLSKKITLTNQQVRTILDNTAVDLGTSGKDIFYGYGKVNPYGALLQTP